jgi:hypothetical protein
MKDAVIVLGNDAHRVPGLLQAVASLALPTNRLSAACLRLTWPSVRRRQPLIPTTSVSSRSVHAGLPCPCHTVCARRPPVISPAAPGRAAAQYIVDAIDHVTHEAFTGSDPRSFSGASRGARICHTSSVRSQV